MSWKYVQRNDESGQYRTTDEGGGGGGSSTFAGLEDVSFSNLQDGQVPKYNSTTQKWENGDETGGTVTDVEVDGVSVVNAQGVAEISIPTPPAAPVQDVQVDGVSVVDGQGVADITIPTPDYPVKDVKVNGISVVDANDEAQITSYEEVTQAQYNALPDSKLSNGVLYCIKDINEGDNAYPPLIYSTEEREIGVWIDGKPLYEKTVTFGAISGGAQFSIPSGVTTVDTLVDVNVMCMISGGGYMKMPLSFPASAEVNKEWGTGWQSFSKSTGNFRIDTGTQRDYLSGFAIFRYTKTTDTPGSGMWTTQGAVAHHYSTNEHIIGTWIDGKPLYERTYVYDITQTLQAGDTDLINVGTGKMIISMNVVLYNKNDGRTYDMTYVGSNASNPSTISFVYTANGYLQSRIRNDTWGTNYCIYATLQYTKTTD